MDHIKIHQEEFDTNQSVISEAEEIWGIKFPEDYVKFLLQNNGAVVYPNWPNLGPENKTETWGVERFYSIGDIIIQKQYPMTYTLHDIDGENFEEHNLNPTNILIFAQGERGVYFMNLAREEHGHIYIANFSGGDGISKTSARSFTEFINSLGVPEWEEEDLNSTFEFSNEYHSGIKVMQWHMFYTPEKPELGLQRFIEVFEYTGNPMPKEDGYPTIIQKYVDDKLKFDFLIEKNCSTDGLLHRAKQARTIQYLVEELDLDINESYKNRYPLQNYLSEGYNPQFQYEVINDLLEMGIEMDWSVKAKLINGDDDLPMIEKLKILHEKYIQLKFEEQEFFKRYNRPSGRPPFIESKLIKKMLGIHNKLVEITDWYSKTRTEETRSLSPQKDESRMEIVEKLLGESLPEEINGLFKKFDGETRAGYGSFFGHSIIGLDEIINSLEFAKTQVKPDVPKITHPEESKLLLEQITKLVVDEIPLKKKFGFIKPKWFKIEFETGPGSLSGPYFYINKDTSEREREVIKLPRDISSEVTALTKELHALEVDDYNWDTLELTVFGNGKNEANRSFYNFDQVLPLKSTPKNAIKKKYFHIKWLPLISDNCGNYIGIDLDPDLCGAKGQVIIFGRDEEDMYVLANSWSEFLDWNLELIGNDGEEFKKDRHLHDIYKELIKARPIKQNSPTPELVDLWKQPAKGYTDKTEGRTEEQILLKEKEIGFTFPELYREHMKIQNGGYLWKSALIHNEDINELLYNGSTIDPIINHGGYTTLKDVLSEYMDLEEIREYSKSDFLDLNRLPILSHMDGHTILCFDYGYNVESEYEIPQIVYFELECADNGFEEKLRVDSYDDLISNLVYYGYESTSFYIGLKSELSIDKIKESFSNSLKVEFKHHDDDGYGWYNFESWYSGQLPVNSKLSIHMRLTPNQFLSGNYLFQKLTKFNHILELDLRIGVTSFADNSNYQRSIFESHVKPALDLFDCKFLLVPFNKKNEQELDHLQSTSH